MTGLLKFLHLDFWQGNVPFHNCTKWSGELLKQYLSQITVVMSYNHLTHQMQQQIPKLQIPNFPLFLKVHIFWEDHKILRILHQLFDWQYIWQLIGGNFAKFVVFSEYMIFNWTKGQLISIWFLVSSNSSKKWTNEFFLLLRRYVLVCFGLFFGRNRRHQKLFLNYLTFK